jgi:hypothetical protein
VDLHMRYITLTQKLQYAVSEFKQLCKKEKQLLFCKSSRNGSSFFEASGTARFFFLVCNCSLSLTLDNGQDIEVPGGKFAATFMALKRSSME